MNQAVAPQITSLAPKKLWLNGVELDLGTRTLRRDGQLLQLRAKTFELLLYLVDHRDRLVSKDELLNELWLDTPVTMDALVQSVLDLRKHLGDEARNPRFIKTVSKGGYQLIAEVRQMEADAAEDEEASIPPKLLTKARRRWVFGAVTALLLLVSALVVVSQTSFLRVKHLFQPPPPDLWEAAWWKLDEGQGSKTTDSIHGLSASLPAGVSWTPGISGSALLFNGGELVVRGNDPGELPQGAEARTMMAWIKTKSTNADSTTVFQLGSAVPHSGAAAFQLTLHESGTAGFGNSNLVLGQKRIDDGRWHQIAGVFESLDSRRMRLFVDGAEQTSTVHEPGGLERSQISAWSIGRAAWGGTSFRGAIDDIRVYGRALRGSDIQSLYRCLSGAADIDIEGSGSHYFAPIFGDNVAVIPKGLGENSSGLRNTGKDFSGVTFARPQPGCGLRSAHGADIGQDLNIEAEFRVSPGPRGEVTDAGPYFRSRRANPGDGIIGGTSAGYWVRLESTGQVRVQRLHPAAMVAFSAPAGHFDTNGFHKLEIAVRAETLEVALDGQVVTFDETGVRRTKLQIPATWKRASPPGNNEGSAGIAFGCSAARGSAGGQEARNIHVKQYRQLTGSAY